MSVDLLASSLASEGGASPRVFVSRFQNILENAAHVLQLQVEVWMDGAGPILSLAPPRACLLCSARTPAMFSDCQNRRWSEAQDSMREGEVRVWSCDVGLSLASIPIQTMERSLGSLIAVDESPVARKPRVSPGASAPENGDRAGSGLEGTGDPEDSDPDALSLPSIDETYEELEPGALLRLVPPPGTEAAPVTSATPWGGPPPGGAEETGFGETLPVEAEGEGHGAFRRKLVFLRDLARLVSDQMFMFSEMSSVGRELSTRNEELNMLYAVTGRLVQFENVRQNLTYILEQARRTVGADAGALAVFDRRILETTVHPTAGTAPSWLGPKTWQRLSKVLRSTLDKADGRYFLGTPWELAGQESIFPQVAQILAVGFPDRGHLGGFVALIRWNTSRNYRGGDLRLLQSLGRQVAMTVSNADLYENLKDFLMATVKSLVSAIEAKDSYTSGHSERVHILSMLLGKTMELDDDTLEVIRWASILHDVGKIGMPECILMKPGKLTPEEYEIVKEHPERGYRVLSPIHQLSVASHGVRAHHEMVDGKGYPQRLSGEEIPFVARIIAVADTYDALTSTRPYRMARPIGEAMVEIRRVRGSQLDPTVVDALEKIVPFLEENQIMIQAASRAA